jgi:Domain of unknown function (DUF4351)
MPYVTSVEQIGFDRGFRIGEKIGREKARRSIVALLLDHKFGELPEHLNDRIKSLSSERLEALAMVLLRLESIDDLTTWLENYG